MTVSGPRSLVIAGTLASALAAVALAQAPAPAAPPPPTADDVLGHVELTIGWYQQVTTAEQSGDLAGDLVSRGRLQQTAVEALQLGFEYARAQAALLRASQTAAPEPPAGRSTSNIEQLNTRLAQRVAALQTRLTDLETSLAHATAKTRASLVAERDAVTSQLQLVKAIQGSVEQIARFAAASQASEAATDSLTAQIDALQRTLPEARRAPAAAAASTQPAGSAVSRATPSVPAAPLAAAQPAFQPESAGIVALATELLRMQTGRRQLAALLRKSDALTESIEQRRAPLGRGIRDLMRQAGASSTAPGDSDQLSQKELQAAVARVKQISTAIVPLGEQGIAVDAARATVLEARTDLTERAAETARYLAIRLVLLLAAIAVVLVVSEVWRRATFRYLRDVRRRRQFLLVRRVVVAAAITLVLVGGFVSQIGTLATYAGFVTAGVAVALQNVILAVVAYFFLIGRYGVRVGDRVTIGGVTGSVIEIGLVRIYLMELAAPDWIPTGRIVVFSNAVLFQPQALFKQVPGVDYGWHTVTLTVAPTADLTRAERDISAAVTGVFEDYRGAIERQHATMQESVNVQTPEPKPDVQIKVTEDGLAMLVRYPVERSRATEMDNRIMTAIRDAVAKAPGIPLAAAGAPRLQEPS